MHSHSGRPCVLSAEEENDLVRCCEVLGEFGVCVDWDMERKVVRDYLLALGRPSPFQDGVLGRKW